MKINAGSFFVLLIRISLVKKFCYKDIVFLMIFPNKAKKPWFFILQKYFNLTFFLTNSNVFWINGITLNSQKEFKLVKTLLLLWEDGLEQHNRLMSLLYWILIPRKFIMKISV